jgi:hypothetical protein
MPKSPTALGLAVEAAISTRFARHRESVQYLACFRTAEGSVFACERVTAAHINLWLPEQEAVKRAAENANLRVERRIAWPDGPNGKYGRISSLKSISGLRDEPLLQIKVTTVGEAMQVLEMLS